MLTVFGAINVDQVIRVEAIARPGETVLGTLETVTFGGKGANQAVAAARVLAGSVPVAMAGAVGAGAQGQDVVSNFTANGVETHLIARTGAPTGTAIIALDASGENAITLVGGANDEVDARQLSAEALAGTDTLLCQGEVDFAASCAVVEAFRSARLGGRVVVNLAPVPHGHDTALKSLLKSTDVLVLNQHEAQGLCALLELTGGTEAAIAALARDTETTIVVTLGADGAYAVEPAGTRARASAPATTVVDTTGAGDTFVGVLAALLTQGEALEHALEAACLAGAISCRKLGAQAGMPTREELMTEALV